MDKIKGLFMVISEYNSTTSVEGEFFVDGPFNYEQAIECKNQIIQDEFELFSSVRIAKLSFLD